MNSLRGSIDLGTNTCLLLLVDWEIGAPEPKRVLRDDSTVVRLGEGVDQERRLNPQAIDRTLNCLKIYERRVREIGLDSRNVVCVATSQARDARNGEAFFRRIEDLTGFRFQVISGDDEARLTFLGGLLPGMKVEQSAVIDIGGGSTEMVASAGGRSVDMGSVRFTERYLKSDPVTDSEFWACKNAIDQQLSLFSGWREMLPAQTELAAVAGTATTLGAWHLGLDSFDGNAVDQVTLSRGDVHRMVEELKWRTVAERRRLPCMEAGRADVILAGALILWRALEILKFPTCRVSSRGLRYGVLKGQISPK